MMWKNKILSKTLAPSKFPGTIIVLKKSLTFDNLVSIKHVGLPNELKSEKKYN